MVTKDSFPISFNHNLRHYTGVVTPLDKVENEVPHHFKVDLVDYGSLHISLVHIDNRWSSPDMQNQGFVNDIGSYIDAWYK